MRFLYNQINIKRDLASFGKIVSETSWYFVEVKTDNKIKILDIGIYC